MNPPVPRRALRVLAFAALGVATSLLGACGGKSPAPSDAAPTAAPAAVAKDPAAAAPVALTPVKFNMAWLPQGSMAGIVVAQDKGYYAARGLQVEAVRGFGGTRTTNEVDQGMFEFGYGDPPSLVLNRANGGRTRMVGVINTSWPAGLCFVTERHRIEKPADLAGLRVGGGQNSPVQVLLPLWLERGGVDPGKVQMLQLNPSVIVASLIEGKIDAAECWRGNSLPLFRKEAQAAGLTLDWIEYAAHGLDIYGSGLITTDKLIAERPEVVAGFVAATYEGYAYAQAHPEEARDLLLRAFPTLDADVTLEQVREISALIGNPALGGAADPARMARTLEFVSAGYDLGTRVAVDDIYTNQFAARP